jgi:hypothetical protein
MPKRSVDKIHHFVKLIIFKVDKIHHLVKLIVFKVDKMHHLVKLIVFKVTKRCQVKSLCKMYRIYGHVECLIVFDSPNAKMLNDGEFGCQIPSLGGIIDVKDVKAFQVLNKIHKKVDQK